jgi:hypothetical protein
MLLGKGSFSLIRPSLFHYAASPEEYQKYERIQMTTFYFETFFQCAFFEIHF